MKICRFNEDRIGLVIGQEVHDISDLAKNRIGIVPSDRPRGDPLVMALPKIAEHLVGGTQQFQRLLLRDVRLLSPVFLPTKVIGAGANYHAHTAEMNADPTASFGTLPDTLEDRGLFLKANTSLVGASEGIALRFQEQRTDYELELVAVVGRRASCIGRDAALDCIAGYCLGVDISLRGPQMRSQRKSIDTYAVAGPWLVTRDEIPDVGNLQLTLSVNGVVRQDTSTADMVDDVATLVQYASQHYMLYPGDLIYTGTCAGVGRLNAGDVLRVEGDQLGSFEVAVRSFVPTPILD